MTFHLCNAILLLSAFVFCGDVLGKARQPIAARNELGRIKRSREALSRARETTGRRALLGLSKGASLAQLKTRLPAGMAVEKNQGQLVVIRSRKPFSTGELAKLKKIPGVAWAQRDSVAVAREDAPTDCAECASKQQNPPIKLPEVAGAIASCSTSVVCPNTGKSKLWAQERVDADLMFDEVARIGAKGEAVSVAVIDSGFDLKTNEKLMASPSFILKKGHDKAAEPSKDEDGHGTMVSSLIGGAGGIGIAPKAALTVYRVSEADSEGTASNADIQLSIEKACSEGNEIINVSWGSLLDETGTFAEEETHKDFIASLAQRGCLVVKAAGNSAYRNRKTNFQDPDDAYLRVAAIADSGNLSRFSTIGEVAAPGSGVFTLVSNDVPSDLKPDSLNLCGTAPGRFINGTSFSAPIVSAVAAQAVAVLKMGERYAKLAGPDRIKLLNRILAASQVAGSVNALRAVLIAEQWVKKGQPEIPESKELARMLADSSAEECGKKSAACSTAAECKALGDCVKKSRRSLALCGAANPDAVADLVDIQIRAGNLEAAAGILHHFRLGSDAAVDQKTQASAATLWNAYHARWAKGEPGNNYSAEINLDSHLDLDAATEVLAVYLKTPPEAEKVKAILKQLFQSYNARHRLSEAPDRGGKESFEAFFEVFRLAAAKLGPEETVKLLQEQVEALSKKELESDFEHYVVLERVIETLLSESAFETLKPALLEIEARLFDSVNKRNLVVRSSTSLYLTPMFERNKEKLLKLAEESVASRNFSGMGSISAFFLVKSPGFFPEGKSRGFVSALVESLLSGMGPWGASNSYIAEDALKEYQKIATETQDPIVKKELIAKFQGAVQASPQYSVFENVFPRTGNDTLPEYDFKAKVDANPLLDRAFLFKLARQEALSIPKQPGPTNEKYHHDRNAVISRMLPFLLNDPNKDVKDPERFTVSVIGTKPSEKVAPIVVENKTSAEALDGLLAFLIDDFKAANQTPPKWEENQIRIWNGIDPVRRILDSKEARQVLPADGAWKKSLSALVEDAEKNKDRYPESLVIQLKKYLQ